MIISPCISICKSDTVTGFCYGCARNHEEKLKWKDKSTADGWKLKNLKERQKKKHEVIEDENEEGKMVDDDDTRIAKK